jgi:hypothetical protein
VTSAQLRVRGVQRGRALAQQRRLHRHACCRFFAGRGRRTRRIALARRVTGPAPALLREHRVVTTTQIRARQDPPGFVDPLHAPRCPRVGLVAIGMVPRRQHAVRRADHGVGRIESHLEDVVVRGQGAGRNGAIRATILARRLRSVSQMECRFDHI